MNDITLMILTCFYLTPFYLIIFAAINDIYTRRKFVYWTLSCVLIVFFFLWYRVLIVEVIYGKELLDYWYATHPKG